MAVQHPEIYANHGKADQVVATFKKLSIWDVKQMIPDIATYAEPEVFHGGHGKFHVPRLHFLVELVAAKLNLSESDCIILHAAVQIHDTRRTHDDRRNRFHGHEAAGWWFDKMHLLENHDIYLDPEEANMALFIGKYHETRQQDIPKNEITQRGERLLKLFKLIDALDRYRDPDPQKHIDLTRYEEDMRRLAHELCPFVKRFVEATEYARHLPGMTPLGVMVHVGREFGLVET